jgi:hypothetical protein
LILFWTIKVALNLEFNKLLVPTTPKSRFKWDVTPEEKTQNDNYRSIGWVSGVFKSFEMRQTVLAKKTKEVTYARGQNIHTKTLCYAWVIFMKVLKRSETILLFRVALNTMSLK